VVKWPLRKKVNLEGCHNAHVPKAGLQKQSKKQYNKQLINLNGSVFTGKSQTLALLY